MRQNLISAFFSKNISHDLAATSNAAHIFLIRKQNSSVTLNLKNIPFDQKKKRKKKNMHLFLFESVYIYTSHRLSLDDPFQTNWLQTPMKGN